MTASLWLVVIQQCKQNVQEGRMQVLLNRQSPIIFVHIPSGLKRASRLIHKQFIIIKKQEKWVRINTRKHRTQTLENKAQTY